MLWSLAWRCKNVMAYLIGQGEENSSTSLGARLAEMSNGSEKEEQSNDSPRFRP